MKKLTIAALAAATVLTFAIPAAAETFTSANGVISIDYPNASWKEMNDPSSWIVLSDGANLITIDHFANGEKLPDIVEADTHYVNTLTAAFTTQNEVFMATGLVVSVLMNFIMGILGVTALNGSYFNVMGLPVQRIYEALKNF